MPSIDPCAVTPILIGHNILIDYNLKLEKRNVYSSIQRISFIYSVSRMTRHNQHTGRCVS